MNLIKQVNETPRRSSYIRRSERGLEFFVRQARENHHTDLLWSCPLADAERDSTWLHRYDKNNAYVAAASGVNLGAGEYILQDHPTFDAKMPGLWHIILEGESAFKTGARIPIP